MEKLNPPAGGAVLFHLEKPSLPVLSASIIHGNEEVVCP
jgi:hypothetical protein